ncbi:MAG: NUDIX hydrolase [Alphaproteobacteria bacterium]
MAFLDHIRVCNEHDPARYLPFVVAGQRVGWVGRDFAGRLAAFPRVFAIGGAAVTMNPGLSDFDARSAAMREVTDALRADGTVTAWRDEFYAVAPRFGAEPLLRVERAAAPKFGVTSLGVHLNGIVRAKDANGGERLSMWVSRRSATKATYPNELDNLCAGGIAHGHGVHDTLIKEAGEEASIPPEIAMRARPASAITYCCERDGGLRPDILFVYDLELPADFTPRPNDGESAGFELWPIERVLQTVRDGFDFKFNCNLVIIDFLIREGLIGPDEPSYLALVAGLRRWVGGVSAGDMIEFGAQKGPR